MYRHYPPGSTEADAIRILEILDHRTFTRWVYDFFDRVLQHLLIYRKIRHELFEFHLDEAVVSAFG